MDFDDETCVRNKESGNLNMCRRFYADRRQTLMSVRVALIRWLIYFPELGTSAFGEDVSNFVPRFLR